MTCLVARRHILLNGSERAVEDARDHLFQIRTLCDFQHVESGGVDQGINVREKSRKIIDLLNDRERLKEEREKARANRGKYGGVSSQRMQGFGSGGGFGNDSNSGFGGSGNK